MVGGAAEDIRPRRLPRRMAALSCRDPGGSAGGSLRRPRRGGRDGMGRAVRGCRPDRSRDVDAALLCRRPRQQSGRDARKAHALRRRDRSGPCRDGSDRDRPSAAVADRRDELRIRRWPARRKRHARGRAVGHRADVPDRGGWRRRRQLPRRARTRSLTRRFPTAAAVD
jgi:hypothetical protein